MAYYKKIVGERVYLSPIDPNDAEIFTAWVNDKNVTQYLQLYDRVFPLSAERETLELISREHNYSIVRLEDDKLLGSCGFHEIKPYDRTASVGIFLGDSAEWGKGYGTEAMKLLVDYGFKTLNFHNIMLTHLAFNDRAHKSYEKAGFREFGRRTKSRYWDGEYYDVVYMEILNPKG